MGRKASARLSQLALPLLAVAAAPPAVAQDASHSGVRSSTDTVFVAAPTGEVEADRANVQAAFDAVQPGGTVRFAPGMYMLGAGARLTVPDVTVLGHPDGTVLRGCDPEAFDVAFDEVDRIVIGCTGFYVQAERQTIRGLTFEYTWHGIVVGPYPTSREEARALEEAGGLGPTVYAAGGQRIEGNTFRATPNGLRVLGTGDEPSVVRDNDFIDVFHAIGIYGAPLHFLDNRITVEDPTRVPFSRHPGSAILVSPGHTNCAGHVVAGNIVEGYPDAFYVGSYRGGTCRGVEIRDNTIRVSRVKVPEAWGGYEPTADDSTMVGAPITLMKSDVLIPGAPDTATAILEQIVVKDNRIIGAEGLGILVQGASHSRIEGNTITGIERRSPFPGLTWDGADVLWEEANGAGIWLSPGSNANEIAGNTFGDVAAEAIVLEGDSNRVEIDGADVTVRDVGKSNRVDAVKPRVDTVRVAPPTGKSDADRASILAALERATPGTVVQFAPGTYRIGEFITVSTPRVTLQGHPDGTTLRGCEPAEFEDIMHAIAACNGFELTGAQQAVRGLTFEHMWHALWVGCCMPDELRAASVTGAAPPHVGGQTIEGNTFRSTVNGFRVIGDSPDPVVVRANDFIDVWHAGGVNGRTAHILDNRILVRDAGAVPPSGFPGLAIFMTARDTKVEQVLTCTGNVIAGNRIEGHPEAIAIYGFGGRGSCRENVIRDNTIRVARAHFTGRPWGVGSITNEADSTLAGVPIALADLSEAMAELLGQPAAPRDEVLIRDNLIEGNRILGAEGLGIELLRASGNRIVKDTISGISVREPFPGNTTYMPPPWGAANGSGIWVSPGSNANEIAGNTFEDVAGAAVVVEGDSNRVALSSQADAARDLGTGNRVRMPDRGAAVESGQISSSAIETGLADRPVAIVRTRTLSWEGEQTYIPLYADGTASGLIVVNFAGGRLYGTSIPESWSWVDRDTIEICASEHTVLRNEVGLSPPDPDCALHPITGKELDQDGDGEVDLIETFDILHESFYRERPGGGAV